MHKLSRLFRRARPAPMTATQQFNLTGRLVHSSAAKSANPTKLRVVALAVVAVVVGLFAAEFDFMERLMAFAQEYEEYELDEIFTVLIFMSVLFGVFAWHQVTELRRHIASRDKAEAAIRHLAMHDALTGLANRAYLAKRLKLEIARAQRDGTQLAVLALDLDGFKQINDFYGHGMGDAVLVAVANRLEEVLRENDTIARPGGDEFAIVLPALKGPELAATLADRIVGAIAKPFRLDDHELSITVSVGITMAESGRTDPEELLRSADLAMYRAKSDGRSTYKFFEPGMDEKLRERRDLELGLRSAIDEGAFTLHYQPLYGIPNNVLKGFEALLRWKHPSLGNVPPDKFIPIAEEIGIIDRIGDWVLTEACRAAAQWPEPLHIAVNVSPEQFKQPDLAERFKDIIDASGLAPERVEIEITEGVLIENTESVLSALSQLKQHGVRVSMDDFGTGYSSLSYLRKFPFDKIKIDRMFVDNAAGDGTGDAIVRAIVAMGHSLGMTTLAEGVETGTQLSRLISDGCDEAQGFYLGKPMPIDNVDELLASIEEHSETTCSYPSARTGSGG